MTLWTTATLFFFSIQFVQANECKDVHKLQLVLAAHGSNIANEQTTRTPFGGSYKRLEVQCSSRCKLTSKADFLEMYEPNHPDANEDGYVKYPNIDPGKEITKFMAALNSLEIMAKRKKCGLELKKATKGFLITYPKGSIKEDHFILPGDMLITGWKRTLRDGTDSLLSFANF